MLATTMNINLNINVAAKKKGSRGSRASGSSSTNDKALARLMEYRQRQEDIRFYLQSYDHLTGEQRMAMEELRVEIKANYDLPY
ncbi:hypothetical protein Tco_0030401 [Tanacetum coccineum]